MCLQGTAWQCNPKWQGPCPGGTYNSTRMQRRQEHERQPAALVQWARTKDVSMPLNVPFAHCSCEFYRDMFLLPVLEPLSCLLSSPLWRKPSCSKTTIPSPAGASPSYLDVLTSFPYLCNSKDKGLRAVTWGPCLSAQTMRLQMELLEICLLTVPLRGQGLPVAFLYFFDLDVSTLHVCSINNSFSRALYNLQRACAFTFSFNLLNNAVR